MTHVQSRDRLFIRLSSFKLVFKNEKKEDHHCWTTTQSYCTRSQSLRQHRASLSQVRAI